MPLPQPHRRYRVRKRGRRHWDRPWHFVVSTILGTCVGLLMSRSFLKEYEQRPAIVLALSDSAAPNCPPINCCVKPR
jgi:DNA-binding transcriptional regulator PaaX